MQHQQHEDHTQSSQQTSPVAAHGGCQVVRVEDKGKPGDGNPPLLAKSHEILNGIHTQLHEVQDQDKLQEQAQPQLREASLGSPPLPAQATAPPILFSTYSQEVQKDLRQGHPSQALQLPETPRPEDHTQPGSTLVRVEDEGRPDDENYPESVTSMERPINKECATGIENKHTSSGKLIYQPPNIDTAFCFTRLKPPDPNLDHEDHIQSGQPVQAAAHGGRQCLQQTALHPHQEQV